MRQSKMHCLFHNSAPFRIGSLDGSAEAELSMACACHKPALVFVFFKCCWAPKLLHACTR